MFVVAPATANIIAKMAHGIADDMLSTTLLATEAPVLIAPAMNTVMWQAEATQENVRILKERGVTFITPESGRLPAARWGKAAWRNPRHIGEEIKKLLALQNDLQGPARAGYGGRDAGEARSRTLISNPSTGKMGYAVAEAAKDRGAEVTLISGPNCAD